MRRLAIVMAGVLIPALAGAQEAAPPRHPVQLRDAWVRPQASAGGMSALYGTLVNASDRDWTVTSVQCDRVRRPELHETVVEHDLVRMQRVRALRIGRGQSVELRPGGVHLMLMDLEAALAPGDYVFCTFLAGDAVVAHDRGIVRAP